MTLTNFSMADHKLPISAVEAGSESHAFAPSPSVNASDKLARWVI
jgi:hypothetical protein